MAGRETPLRVIRVQRAEQPHGAVLARLLRLGLTERHRPLDKDRLRPQVAPRRRAPSPGRSPAYARTEMSVASRIGFSLPFASGCARIRSNVIGASGRTSSRSGRFRLADLSRRVDDDALFSYARCRIDPNSSNACRRCAAPRARVEPVGLPAGNKPAASALAAASSRGTGQCAGRKGSRSACLFRARSSRRAACTAPGGDVGEVTWQSVLDGRHGRDGFLPGALGHLKRLHDRRRRQPQRPDRPRRPRRALLSAALNAAPSRWPTTKLAPPQSPPAIARHG